MDNVGVNMERWKTHMPVFDHGFGFGWKIEDQQKLWREIGRGE